MRIELDITRSPTGRIAGVLGAGEAGAEVAFSGTLELVAALEAVLDQDLAHPPSAS